jgi:hypothetical protein
LPGYDTPVVTLDGAIELLLTMKSELKGCMIKLAAKEVVDGMAGTAEMRERLERNSKDPTREGLRRSCENRDASGDGHAFVGGGGGGAGGAWMGMSIEELERKAEALGKFVKTQREFDEMAALKRKGDDYYFCRVEVCPCVCFFQSTENCWLINLFQEGLILSECKKIQELRNTATDIDAKNAYSELILRNVKRMMYPGIAAAAEPDRPEEDYMTVEEMIEERADRDSVRQYAQAVGAKMSKAYRDAHGQQPPPKRDVPGNIKPNKYLEQDRKYLELYIQEAKQDALRKLGHLPKGQQSILEHMNRVDGGVGAGV